jgi:hypothetical protein
MQFQCLLLLWFLIKLPLSSTSPLLLVLLYLLLCFASPQNAYSFPQFSTTTPKFSSLLPLMILLSSHGFYFVTNWLQPEHVDPLFPFEALWFIPSSSYPPPIVGYTSLVVGFLCFELSLLLPTLVENPLFCNYLFNYYSTTNEVENYTNSCNLFFATSNQ